MLDQFEEDENGLVFYWNGRGPPVRVTYQERDEIVERHQRLDRIFAVVGLIGLVASLAAVANEAVSFPAFIVILAALIFALSTIQDLFAKIMLRPYLTRVPVGPARTRKELFLRAAREAKWSHAVLLGWPLMLYYLWPRDGTESTWIKLGVIGVGAITVVQVLALLGAKFVLEVTQGATTGRLRRDRLGEKT